MDLSAQLALWRAGKLNGAPPKGLLGRLEAAHKGREAKIRESRVLIEEARRLELTEARRRFREEHSRLRRDILEGMSAAIEQEERKASPPATGEELSRMSLLSGVHLPVWQRSPGNLVADAVSFEQQGDVAGLKLARKHVGLLSPGQRSKAAASIDEALADFRSAEQRAAEQRVSELKAEREEFDLGTGARPINRLYADVPPPPSTPSPTAVPQR